LAIEPGSAAPQKETITIGCSWCVSGPKISPVQDAEEKMEEVSSVMSFWIRLFALACILFWALMSLAIKHALLATARACKSQMFYLRK